MDRRDDQQRPYDTRPDDVRLMEAGLPDPATDMECVSEADQDVDGRKEKWSCASSRKAPRQQRKGKDWDAVW